MTVSIHPPTRISVFQGGSGTALLVQATW